MCPQVFWASFCFQVSQFDDWSNCNLIIQPVTQSLRNFFSFPFFGDIFCQIYFARLWLFFIKSHLFIFISNNLHGNYLSQSHVVAAFCLHFFSSFHSWKLMFIASWKCKKKKFFLSMSMNQSQSCWIIWNIMQWKRIMIWKNFHFNLNNIDYHIQFDGMIN